MKVEIKNDDFSHTRGSFVYVDGKKVYNKQGGMFPFDFDENDILDLLGEKRYSQYEKGKYIFELTRKEIFNGTNDSRFYKP
jgi:hypothetical protein